MFQLLAREARDQRHTGWASRQSPASQQPPEPEPASVRSEPVAYLTTNRAFELYRTTLLQNVYRRRGGKDAVERGVAKTHKPEVG